LISEGKPLRDEDILQELPVGTTATFYFKDLGSQMTWGTVSVLTYTQTSKYNHIQHCFSFSTCVDSKTIFKGPRKYLGISAVIIMVLSG